MFTQQLGSKLFNHLFEKKVTHQISPYLFYLSPDLAPVLVSTFLSFVFIQNYSFIALGIPIFTQNLQNEDLDAHKYGFLRS